MKKKEIIVCTLSIVVILTLLIVIVAKQEPKYIMQDGVMLALTLDGNPITSFPEETNYRVAISCENGKGIWLVEEWKFAIEDITGNVICNIDFTTRSEADKLKSIVESNAINAGEVIVSTSDATYTKLTQDEYGTITNTSTYPFVWDEENSQWTQSATSSKSSSYFKFYPSEAGAYQICYILPSSSYTSGSSSYKNYITLHSLNTTSTIATLYSNYNNGATITECVDYGYVTPSDYIYIKGYYYDKNISFYAQKTDDFEKLSAGYRYSGKTPDNWIWFNNELWRIIGSIPTCTSSGCATSENLVKIIRAESIGGLAYDTVGNTAVWGSNTLYTLLNTYYYGKLDATGASLCSKSLCNYTKIGVSKSDYYGKMVKNVYWNTGASFDGVKSAESYILETIAQAVSGHIGLMSASDYKYASGSTLGSNWLYSQGTELTSTKAFAYSNRMLHVDYTNSIYTQYVVSSYHSVRPVLYLDSSVYVISGEGTQASPYMLGM